MQELIVSLNFSDAQLPTRGTEFSAGYDLYSYDSVIIEPQCTILLDTGISITVPDDTYGRIAPRSSVSKKQILTNAGVIDKDYTGPVKVMLHNLSDTPFTVDKGDRIAQLILEVIKTPSIKLVETLSVTERGDGGFGSTGK